MAEKKIEKKTFAKVYTPANELVQMVLQIQKDHNESVDSEENLQKMKTQPEMAVAYFEPGKAQKGNGPKFRFIRYVDGLSLTDYENEVTYTTSDFYKKSSPQELLGEFANLVS